MKIAVWNCHSDSIENFMDIAESFSELILFDALDDYLEDEEQFDLLAIDYDSDKKNVDKFLKLLKKNNDETKILILSNILTPKQLVKHQSSKSGADIYLRTPLTHDLLRSIFEPFFDIEIEQESAAPNPVVNLNNLSKEDRNIQSKVLEDHSINEELNIEAKNISDSLDKKFNLVFPQEKNVAARMLEQLESEDSQNASNQIEEFDLSSDLDSDHLTEDDDISVSVQEGLSDDLTGDFDLESDLGSDSEQELLIEEEFDETVDEELLLGEVPEENLSLEEDLEEELSLADESSEVANLVSEDNSMAPPSLDDLELAQENEEGMIADTSLNDEVNLEDVEADELGFAQSGDEQVVAKVEAKDEVDLSQIESEDLDLSSLDSSESTANVLPNDEVDLGQIDSEALDIAENGDANTVSEVETKDNVDLEEVQAQQLDIAQNSDSEVVSSVVSKDEIELDQIQQGDISLSAEGEAPESINIVTDEIDLSSEATVKKEEKAMATEDDENTLDIGGDEEILDLSADEDILDIGTDDEGLDLTDEFSLGEDTEIEPEGDILDLAGEESSFEIDDSIDSPQELSLDDNDGLSQIDDEQLADNLADDSDESMELLEDDFGIEQLEQVDEEALVDLEFGSLTDDSADDEKLSAADLPPAPEGLNPLEELDNTNVEMTPTNKHSDDVLAKLAEIDAMMDESAPVVQDPADNTGEHDIQALKNEEDEGTDIISVESIQQLDEIAAENIEFGAGAEAENEVEDNIITISEGDAKIESKDINQEPIRSTQTSTPSQANISEHNAYKQRHDEELTRYGESIKNLREEREYLLEEIRKLQESNEDLKREAKNMKAQLDEKKIEITIVKKRHEKEVEELKYQLDISNDRKDVLEEKNKQFEKEYENLNRKIKVDITKVRSRERDLENKLEMLRSDAEMQIRNRDQKILELKRKIDTLQFDVESIQVQEKKIVSNNNQLEDKMQKVIRTLRRAIGELEEDGTSIRSIEEIKKNLDV